MAAPSTTHAKLRDQFLTEIDPKGWSAYGCLDIPDCIPKWTQREDRTIRAMEFFSRHWAKLTPTSRQVRVIDLPLYKQLHRDHELSELNWVMPSEYFISEQLLQGVEARYGETVCIRLKRAFRNRASRSQRETSLSMPAPD